MSNRPVEQRHREAAVKLLESALYPIDAVKGIELIAQALADAEQPAPSAPAEFDPWEALVKAAAIFDYRLRFLDEGKRGWHLQVGPSTATGATPTDAARNLCRKLGLTESPKGKESP